MSDPELPVPQALPRRASRASEATQFLREKLLSGCWPHLLPGEVELARQLQVGRNTVRSALAQLESEGWISTQMGRRRQVTASPPPGRSAQTVVKRATLLLATPLHTLAPNTLLWMDTLRQQLLGSGWLLETQVQPAAFKKNPAAALSSLTAGSPATVWILHRAPQATQTWFQTRQVPAVVAGTRHGSLSLPQVDTDYRAVCRHAAARLTSLGHRRLGLLTSRLQLAGDAESVAGFLEGAGSAEVEMLPHNETPEGVVATLKAAFSVAASRPTALFSLRAEHHATALSWLLAQGLRIPAHLSLLCRDDEPFLHHLYPEPARYRRSAETFAKKLARLVVQCTQPGGQSAARSVLLMPDFVRGDSLGPPPTLTGRS